MQIKNYAVLEEVEISACSHSCPCGKRGDIVGKYAMVKAPSKINLTLDITDKNSVGYHNMKMVMQSIDFFDKIMVKKTNSEKIVVTDKFTQIPPESISYRVAEEFFAYTGIKNCGIKIEIENNIPQCAGLAGGSADGAGVIVALNNLFDAKLTQNQLCEIGVKIGADIPFCIVGGTAFAEGIGDKLTPLRPLEKGIFVVVKPEWGVSTPEAFRLFDEANLKKRPNNFAMLKAIECGKLEDIGDNLGNVFQYIFENEDVENICTSMTEMGALGASMTGSGSAVFGLFADEKKAQLCLSNLKKTYTEGFLARPFGSGAVIVNEK